MITAYATFETAVSAWQRGAFNCIRKPFENEDILRVVEAGIRRRRKDEEHAQLRRTLQQSADKLGIIARSAAMRDILALVEQIAPARTTVLIQGESGTGKELIARAIHFASPRAKTGQFVPVNCGNIPTELLESELFGHSRGAFTGAFTAKKKVSLTLPTAGHCFWMKLATSPLKPRANCCASSRSGSSSHWGKPHPTGWTPASWPPPIST